MEISTFKEITRVCEMCGKASKIMLTETEYAHFEMYLRNGGYIQECLSTLNPCEREFLKSGYCRDCQELIFGNGKSERLMP